MRIGRRSKPILIGTPEQLAQLGKQINNSKTRLAQIRQLSVEEIDALWQEANPE